MTTTNDAEQFHPMVMKAARAISEFTAQHMGDSFERVWRQHGAHHTKIAHAALTACGALECLEALEMHNRATGYTETDAADVATIRALAKVYGSAPG